MGEKGLLVPGPLTLAGSVLVGFVIQVGSWNLCLSQLSFPFDANFLKVSSSNPRMEVSEAALVGQDVQVKALGELSLHPSGAAGFLVQSSIFYEHCFPTGRGNVIVALHADVLHAVFATHVPATT